ncbi:MAG: leucine-rich repeat protein [Oscillospiraceae bacterium]|nr:leucine-rich repeat protein [Oscillospiraceae bacterium]
MICNSCGKELPEGKKFCIFCGAKIVLKKICAECGSELEPDAEFCGECGTKYSGGAAAPAAKKTERKPASGGRKAAPGRPAPDKFKVPANAVVIPKNIAESEDEDEIKEFFSGYSGRKVFTFASDVSFAAENLFCNAGDISAESIYVPDNVKVVKWHALDCESIKNVYFAEGVRYIDHNFDGNIEHIMLYESTKSEESLDKYNIKIDYRARTNFEPPADAVTIPRAFVEGDVECGEISKSIRLITENPDCYDFVIEPGTKRIGRGTCSGNNWECRDIWGGIVLYLPDSVEEIADSAFYDNIVTSINFPASLKRIGKCTMDDLKMRKVFFPYGVEEISSCPEAAEEVVIPDSVKIIGAGTFSRCPKLKKLELPNSVEKINSGAFPSSGLKMESLVSLTMPEQAVITDDYGNTGSLTLKDLPKLNMLKLPETIKGFGYLYVNGEYYHGVCFENLPSLRSLTIPQGTEWVEYKAFEGCNALEALMVPYGTKLYEEHGRSGIADTVEKADDDFRILLRSPTYSPEETKKIQIIRY